MREINFDKNLCNASLVCEGFYYNSEFFRIYSFATENISGYIDYFDFNNKKLLTVVPSQQNLDYKNFQLHSKMFELHAHHVSNNEELPLQQ